MTRVLASIVCVLGLLSAPFTAEAYYLESRGTSTEPVRYDTATPVEYRIGTLTGAGDPTAVAAAIDAAFATWSAADCSNITFVRGPDEAPPHDPSHWMARPMDRYVLVYFSDDPGFFPGPLAGFWAFGHDNMGGLLGGTVILNTLHHSWATDGDAASLDVQGTVTALIGRSLGITSRMDGNATNGRYAPGDTTKRMLGPDDLAAIGFLYPEGAACGMTGPEMVCDGAAPTMCPPPTTMMMGDGGVGIDGGGTLRDGGTPMGTDGGGTRHDSGMGGGGDDEGGCCSVPGASRSGTGRGMLALGVAMALGMTLVVRRRRRPRCAGR